MKQTAIAAIGVDRGGTWTRVAAYDRRPRRLRYARFRTVPLRALPGKLTALLAAWPGASSAPLVIATRGAIGRKWKIPFLTRSLKGILNLARVVSDAEAAHRAAFRGKPGLLLLAGTGAVVFSGKPGAFKTTGGLNPPSGDPGSGRWLGRHYLKIKGRLREAAGMSHGECAAHAKKLLALAEAGNADCLLAARAAAHELLSLLGQAAPRGPITAALAGGLMESVYFRGLLATGAATALPRRKLRFICPAMPAEEAAARLALELSK